MGTARGRYPDQVFGRLTLKIVKYSKAPVLMIPSGSKIEEIEKITYASYHSSSNDEKAIRFLSVWSKILSATIDVLNICDKHQLENAKNKQIALGALFEENGFKRPIKFVLKERSTARMIEEYQALTQADLLVIATHQAGFWPQLFEPAVTQQLAQDTLVPLLILKQ